MQSPRCFRRPVLAAALAMFVVAGVARAQVIQQVPSDALVVVKFNNLQQVSKKVANFAQQLGIAQMQPEFADPLGSLEKEAKISKGLDRSGELVITMLDPEAHGGPDQSALILIPVTDYNTFVSNFADAKADGAVTQATMGDGGRPHFMANWGKYAAMSPSRDVVAQKPSATLQVQGMAAKEMQGKDAVLFVNMPAIRAKAVPMIQQQRQAWLAQMEQGLAGNPNAAKMVPLARTAFNMALSFAEQLLNESQSVTFGVNLTNDGINITSMGEFLPGSKLGQQIARIKNSDQSMLNGLPQGKYIFSGGFVCDPKATTEIFNDVVGPVTNDLNALGDQGKAVSDWLSAMRAQLAATNGSTFGVLVPNAPMGAGSLIQEVVVVQGDAPALTKAMKDNFAASNNLSQSFQAALQPQGQAMQMPTYSFNDNAKTINGVKLDQIQMKLNDNPQTPQEAQALQMLRMIYGPQGLSGYLGAVDPKHVVMGMGLDDQLMQQAVAAAKANKDALSSQPELRAVSGQLPQNRMAVGYFALDQLITTGVNYAKQMGMPVNLQLPPNLSPIGMTLASQGSAIHSDVYIPTQLVQSIVAASMQMMMQMQGGKQPGGPGGL